jgi:DNA-binding MarR family transcriptional regulator
VASTPRKPSRGSPAPARAAGASIAVEALADELPRHISHLARMVYRATGSPLPRALRSVLFALSIEPLRVSDVAATEGIGQSAATRLVGRLEALNLVRRERGAADGRVVMVTLTEQGAAELELMRAQSRRVMREALADCTARQLRQLATAAMALDALEQSMRARRQAER